MISASFLKPSDPVMQNFDVAEYQAVSGRILAD